MIEVPDVVGKNVDDAKQRAGGRGFEVERGPRLLGSSATPWRTSPWRAATRPQGGDDHHQIR